MGRKRKYVDPRKQQLIRDFLEFYKPESVAEIHSSLTELLGGTFESMLNSELDDHIETINSLDDQDYHDSRNGYSVKNLNHHSEKFQLKFPEIEMVHLLHK